MDRQLAVAYAIWDWESPNPGRFPVEVGDMISWDDKLRMWRISGKSPRVVHCPVCEETMTPCHEDRWVCLNTSGHEEALDKE